MTFFEKKVRPVLVDNCYNCHSANTNARGGLRVDVYPDADKLGKQFKYASSRSVPFVAIVGKALQRNRLQAEGSLTAPAEGGDDLVERQDEIDVVRCSAQPGHQPSQHLLPTGPQEGVLDVRAREAGVTRHDRGSVA